MTDFAAGGHYKRDEPLVVVIGFIGGNDRCGHCDWGLAFVSFGDVAKERTEGGVGS